MRARIADYKSNSESRPPFHDAVLDDAVFLDARSLNRQLVLDNARKWLRRNFDQLYFVQVPTLPSDEACLSRDGTRRVPDPPRGCGGGTCNHASLRNSKDSHFCHCQRWKRAHPDGGDAISGPIATSHADQYIGPAHSHQCVSIHAS